MNFLNSKTEKWKEVGSEVRLSRTGAEGDDPYEEELTEGNPEMELVPPVLLASGAVLVEERLLARFQQRRGRVRHWGCDTTQPDKRRERNGSRNTFTQLQTEESIDRPRRTIDSNVGSSGCRWRRSIDGVRSKRTDAVPNTKIQKKGRRTLNVFERSFPRCRSAE